MFALQALLDRLPRELVDEAAAKRVRLLADPLPDAVSHRIGLEARLGDDPRVDLLLLAATRRELETLGELGWLAGPAAAQPGWRAAARLARRSLRLLTDGDPLPPGIWLELDAAHADADADVGARGGGRGRGRGRGDGGDPGTPDPPRSPALFTAAAADPDHPAAGPWDIAGTVADVVGLVTDAPPARALLAAVRRVVASPLLVRQVGCFPGRPGAAQGVRLFCQVPPATPVSAALEAAGWRGDAGPVDRLAETARRLADHLHLGLDVTAAGPQPAVGLEISYTDAAQPGREPRWERLLRLLVDTGVCTAAKAEAVRGLDQVYQVRLPYQRLFRKGVHHLKLSVDAAGAVTGKVYFGAYEVTTARKTDGGAG